MTLKPDEMFARFKIIRKIGEGGMGQVFLAEDQKLGRRVALKILLSEFVTDSDRLSRFKREAQTAAQISHPNVMAIYDLDTVNHEPSGQDLTFIVMEYIQGRSLDEYLMSRQPPMGELLRLGQRIASGLAAAHRLSIVHRDIKFENVLVDESGEPRILDFGLAKPIDVITDSIQGDSTRTVSQELTQEGKILGTISYMSPEQARGEAVDSRSDVFSFGILLYRMFAGRSPFEASDRVSVLAKILEGQPAPLRQVNEAAPAELERIVDKCLRKDPNERYQDTRDLVVDLRSLRRYYDSGISDSSSITGERAAVPRKTAVFHVSGWKAVAGIAGLVLLALIMWGLSGGEDRGEPADDARTYAERITQEISQSLAEAGIDLNSELLQIPGVAGRSNALAILGFENKTGDSEFDWLSTGLPEILLTDLTQGGSGNIISRGRVLDCLVGSSEDSVTNHTHQACVHAARSLGASKVLSGSFFKLGDKIRIDARLEDAKTGTIILAEKVVGEDPFLLVDSLTGKIAASLDMVNVRDDDVQVAQVTSSSPEAYKQYILGMELFEIGKLDSSISLFEEAIALDSAFALPYMRIGMAYGMQGMNQKGATWFAMAQQQQDRLPSRQRLLLDAYTDIWLNRQFDDAMVKMGSFINQYPDEKEARAFYGVLLYQLAQRTDEALAQLDTAAMIDDSYYWVLAFYEMIYNQTDQVEKAIDVNRRLKRDYPNHPDPYLNMADLYRGQGKIDSAIAECRALLDREPNNKGAHRRLLNYYLLRREVDSAEEQARKLLSMDPDDPATIDNYHARMANLAEWRGQFQSALRHLQESLEAALETRDSNRVFGSYSALAKSHGDFGNTDSALHYFRLGHDWARMGHEFNLAIGLVATAPENTGEARSIFREAANNFKARVPEQMWSLIDNLEMVFEGYADNDTAAIIQGLITITENPQYSSTADYFELGKLLVLAGKHEKGRDYLVAMLEGPDQTADGYSAIMSHYWAGRADQALGNNQAAIDHFSEMLQWWDDPDIMLEEIQDARSRLQSLTS